MRLGAMSVFAMCVLGAAPAAHAFEGNRTLQIWVEVPTGPITEEVSVVINYDRTGRIFYYFVNLELWLGTWRGVFIHCEADSVAIYDDDTFEWAGISSYLGESTELRCEDELNHRSVPGAMLSLTWIKDGDWRYHGGGVLRWADALVHGGVITSFDSPNEYLWLGEGPYRGDMQEW